MRAGVDARPEHKTATLASQGGTRNTKYLSYLALLSKNHMSVVSCSLRTMHIFFSLPNCARESKMTASIIDKPTRPGGPRACLKVIPPVFMQLVGPSKPNHRAHFGQSRRPSTMLVHYRALEDNNLARQYAAGRSPSPLRGECYCPLFKSRLIRPHIGLRERIRARHAH